MAIKIPYLVIEPYIFLFVASWTLTGLVVPQLLLDVVCHRNFNSTVCSNINKELYKKQQDVVQKESALWLTSIVSTESGLAIIACLFIGPLADTIGSRNTMFLTPIFTGIQYIVLIVLTSLGRTFHPALFLVSVPFSSACGTHSGAMMLGCSYVSTVTTEKDRSFRLAFVSGAFSFSACLVAFVSGYLITWMGYRGVFVTCVIINVLNVLYLIFFVSDVRAPDTPAHRAEVVFQNEATQNTHDKAPSECVQENDGREKASEVQNQSNLKADISDKNDIKISPASSEYGGGQNLSFAEKFKTSLARSNPLTNLKELYYHVREQKQQTTVLSLLFSSFASILSWQGEAFILVLFIKNRPLNFSAIDVGYLISFQGLNWGLTGYVLVNIIFQRCCKFSDFFVITATLFSHGVYLILLGFSTTRIMIYIIQIFSGIAALDIPTTRSSLTKIVGPNKYATVLAVSGTFQSLGSFVASFGATVIYAEFVSIHRGAGFFFLALIVLASVAITGRLFWNEKFGNQTGGPEQKLNLGLLHK